MGAPASQPARAPAASSQPPSAAIDYLKRNNTPFNKAEFDKKYGQGAAAKVLGK
jgi:hypothetical protein